MIHINRCFLFFLIACPMIFASGCRGKSNDPRYVAQQFIRSVQSADLAEIYQSLSRDTQKQLQQLARLASAQTGSMKKMNPEDLLNVGYNSWDNRITSIKLEEIKGTTARVKIQSSKQTSFVLPLKREDNQWRVVLDLTPESAAG